MMAKALRAAGSLATSSRNRIYSLWSLDGPTRKRLFITLWKAEEPELDQYWSRDLGWVDI